MYDNLLDYVISSKIMPSALYRYDYVYIPYFQGMVSGKKILPGVLYVLDNFWRGTTVK